MNNENYIDEHPHYTHPMQCKFYDGAHWEWGIIFRDFTIRAKDGQIFFNHDCAMLAILDGLEDWVQEFEWVDLTKKTIDTKYLHRE